MLIVEFDYTLKIPYTIFFGHGFIDVVTASGSSEGLSLFRTIDFDMIILGRHLSRNQEHNDIAKEIDRIKCGRRIVLTTPDPVYFTLSITNCFKVNKEENLGKPPCYRIC